MSLLRKVLILLGAMFATVGVLLIGFIAFKVITRPGDDERIERTLEAYFRARDRNACEDRTTEAFRSQRYAVSEPFALALCESELPVSAAAVVRIDRIVQPGAGAGAEVSFEGGSFDGSTLRVLVSEKDGVWRLERILEFKRFDRAASGHASRNELLALGAPRSAAECVRRAENHRTDAELEQARLVAVRQAAAPLMVRCARPMMERSLLSTITTANTWLTGSELDCIEGGLDSAGAGELARLTYEIPAYITFIDACDHGYLVRYIRRELRGDDEDPATVECAARRLESMPLPAATSLAYDEDRLEGLIDCN